MNTVWKIVLGAAGTLAAIYLVKLDNTTKNLSTQLRVMVHALKWNGLTIKVIANLNNPSPLPLSIQYPYIELFFESKLIGNSIIENKVEIIEADSSKTLEFMIFIPLLGLVGSLFNLFKSITSGQAIKVKAKIVTALFTQLARVPYTYEVEQTLDLKNFKPT
jgi:hypothetical protein